MIPDDDVFADSDLGKPPVAQALGSREPTAGHRIVLRESVEESLAVVANKRVLRAHDIEPFRAHHSDLSLQLRWEPRVVAIEKGDKVAVKSGDGRVADMPKWSERQSQHLDAGRD